jgi:hypothetical protein
MKRVMILFSDHCEAGRFLGDGNIVYYIDNQRCTREEFHRYRAKEKLTDFVGTEFSNPVTYNKITIGHWRSFVNDCIRGYLEAANYDDSMALAFYYMDLKDKYFTIDQMNYIYNCSKEWDYANKVCPLKKFQSCITCHNAPEDVCTCIDIDEMKASDDAYGEWMDKELRQEREKELDYNIDEFFVESEFDEG